MSTGEKKSAQSTTPPPPGSPTQQQQAPASQPVKKALVSRRTFLRVAVGASTVLAAASMVSSGAIMEPLIPREKDPQVIASALDLESEYAASSADPNIIVSRFFYWPYDESVSPYYRNILVRLPDELVPEADRGPTPFITHYAAFNTTCVHLRCLVNPGVADDNYRLLCPCHGSQYALASAVPVKGPALDLGLRPLPRIKLSLDSSNQIIAEDLIGEPGIGRSQV